jgi:UDP-glucose 4-epimerase
MNVLVLGAAGFIGSHLIRKLVADGHRVSAVDVNGALAKRTITKNVPFYCRNFGIRDPMIDVLKRENAELVVQCAGTSVIPDSVSDPTTCYATNAIGNTFLLDLLVSESVKKIIYLSSAAVFGEVDKMPITDNTVRQPINSLGNAQLFVENALESYRISHGLTYAIIRASNVTGMSEVENDHFVKNLGEGLIPTILRQITGQIGAVDVFGTNYHTVDGTAERDYIHVDDLCNACACVIPKMWEKGYGMAFNVGSGRKYSVREVISIAESIFGVKVSTEDRPRRTGDASRAYFDIYHTRNVLEWAPKYDSMELIFKTISPYFSGKQRSTS